VSDNERDDQILALLYATGQLDGDRAADFERRLADDQAAREALCTAVRLNWAIDGQSNPGPDPAYRDRVRQRLQMSKSLPSAGRRLYRLHPAVWAVGGAAVAALLLVSIRFHLLTIDAPESQPANLADQMPAHPGTDVASDDADAWPELMSGEHLAQAVEESRRKVRTDEHRIARMEDNGTRIRSAPVYRQ
jgi:anti-sigma-K factor RskA